MKKILAVFLFPAMFIILNSLFAEETVPMSAPVSEYNPIIPIININDMTVTEATRLITELTNIPVIASKEASNIRISLYLKNCSVRAVIDALCQSAGLWGQPDPKSGIIMIQTIKEFKESLQTSSKDNLDVVQIMYPDASDIGDALKMLFVNKVHWIRNDEENLNSKTQKIERSIERMDLLAERGVFGLSGSNDAYSGSGSASKSPSSYSGNSRGQGRYGNAYGGGFSSYTTGGIFGVPDPKSPVVQNETQLELENANRFKLENLITRLGGKNAVNYVDIASNPGTVFISTLPEGNALMLRSADDKAIEQVKEIIAKLDKPSPQVLLEIKILSVRLDDTHERALDFLFKSGDFGGGFAGDEKSPGGESGAITLPNDNGSSGNGLTSKYATFSAMNKNFNVRFQMLKTDDRLTELATPNLLVSDNEASTFFLGNEVTVMEKAQKTTTYIQTTDVGAYLPNINWEITAPRRQIGTSVLITPKIHPDRSVTIRLMQEQSSLGPERINTFSAATGQTNESQTFISQDINLQNLTTTIMAQDQNLVVIGGLITENVTKYLEKVPWFSEIPYIGELLFSRLREGRARNEILVIIRPFVLLAPGEADAVSRSFFERISQHPSAKKDIPALNVNYPKDIAKPRNVNPDDPWVLRTWDRIRDWSVDDITPPEVEEAVYETNRKNEANETGSEVERIRKKVVNPSIPDPDLEPVSTESK